MDRNRGPLTRKLARTLVLVRDAWAGFGLLLLLLLAVDGVARWRVEHQVNRVWRAAAEAYHGAPWVVPYWREQQQVEERWEPFSYYSLKPYQGRYIHVDAAGRRRTWNRPLPERRNAVRIALFGGSTVWGFGVRDDDTLPSQLSRLLAAAGLEVIVTNYGQIAHVSSQQVVCLLRALESAPAPQIVVFYDGINDTLAALSNQRAGVTISERERAQEFRLQSQPSRLLTALFRGSGLVRWLQLREPPLPIAGLRNPARAELLAGEVLRRYGANVRLVEEAGRIGGFQSLFYWQPLVLQKRHLTPYERRMGIGGSAGDFFARVYREAPLYRPLARDPRFHDISSLFAETTEPRFLDRFHLGEEGNREVAERMLQDLTPLVAQAKRTPPG
ncbi:MAG TPA: SGNH/GDSL hydrolase family protein [Thermoanaerobaculia bacterium]|jgi:lysophospholipase L1-like esterase|nr:SGNH/GDSL hydrolase family protein [Thermoanaerobaculia bacterium]